MKPRSRGVLGPPLSRRTTVWLAPRSPPLAQSPLLDRGDLQRDQAAVDAGLREGAGGEPQSGLRRAGPHVAEFLGGIIEAPDPADAISDISAEQLPQQMIRALVAGGEHDQFGVHLRAAL